MEFKQIKELMAAMGRTGTKRLTIKREGFELQLERHDNSVLMPTSETGDEFGYRHELPLPRAAVPLTRDKEIHHPTPKQNVVEEMAGVYVTSPMVGTYYASPAPDEAHFVKVGDRVEKHTVVCIIEAMKVMNEVKSGVAGTVAEILVENGQPVEFGTKLLRIT